jgi:hypothetical protein
MSAPVFDHLFRWPHFDTPVASLNGTAVENWLALAADGRDKTMQHQSPIAYAHSQRGRFVAELSDFIRFSLGGQAQHAEDVRKCAAWLTAHLRKIGLGHVRVVPTAGHPLVCADWVHVRCRPTPWVYGKLQPIDPLDAWHSPPFEPTVRGHNLYGRRWPKAHARSRADTRPVIARRRGMSPGGSVTPRQFPQCRYNGRPGHLFPSDEHRCGVSGVAEWALRPRPA